MPDHPLLDQICLDCPLATCDMNSLWCFRQLLDEPNEAQKKVAKNIGYKRLVTFDRRDYWKARYEKKKQEKVEAGT